MNRITKEEFRNSKEYCLESEQTFNIKLVDNLDEYLHYEVGNLISSGFVTDIMGCRTMADMYGNIPVYKKERIRLPKGFIRKQIERYLGNDLGTEYKIIDEFENNFNSMQHKIYKKGGIVGYINLIDDIQNWLEHSLYKE